MANVTAYLATWDLIANAKSQIKINISTEYKYFLSHHVFQWYV